MTWSFKLLSPLVYFLFFNETYCPPSPNGFGNFLCLTANLYYVSLMCREGSIRGCGIRASQSAKGSDSWVDDPITRHIIGVYMSKEEGGDVNNDINYLLWPLVLHTKGQFCILVLPLVEPRHVRAYARLCTRSDCGNAVGVEDSISSILLDLPSITGYGKLLEVFF